MRNNWVIEALISGGKNRNFPLPAPYFTTSGSTAKFMAGCIPMIHSDLLAGKVTNCLLP